MKTEWHSIVPNSETKANDIFDGEYAIIGDWPNQYKLKVGWIVGCRYCAFWFGRLWDRDTSAFLKGWLLSQDIEPAKAEAVGTIKQRLWEMTEKMEGVEA